MFGQKRLNRGSSDQGNARRGARTAIWLALAATITACTLPLAAQAASNDNDVEWKLLFGVTTHRPASAHPQLSAKSSRPSTNVTPLRFFNAPVRR